MTIGSVTRHQWAADAAEKNNQNVAGANYANDGGGSGNTPLTSTARYAFTYARP